jgi:PKD repeat protein
LWGLLEELLMRLSMPAGLARLPPALLALALVAAALPGDAPAATFCVHSPPECAGTNEATLQDALDAADANGANRDEIRIGVGLFNDGPAVNAVGSPVDLIGVAANQTAIRSSSTTSGLVILDVQEPTSTLRDLRVHHNSAAPIATGLKLAGDAERVLVTNQSAAGQVDGVWLVHDAASFVDSSVVLAYPENLQNRAVFVPPGASPAIAGSFLEGTVGVADSGETTILRTRIRATQGVVAASGGSSTVTDTEIRVPGPFDSEFQVAALAAAGNGATDIDADRVTAHGDGTGYGAWVQPNSGGGNNASITLDGSVLDDFATDIYLTEEGGANAALTAARSAYDSTNLSIGPGTIFTPGTGIVNLAGTDPRFADPAAGDLSLLHDSPLIDKGDPGFQPLFGGLDVRDRIRVRDGDGNGSSVVDIGAHEYQRRPPLAVASAPASGEVGQALTFDGSESSDPDDEALTYSWSFDDGTEADGAVVQKAFATPGPHTGTLTVTDPAGVSDDAVVTVTIDALPDSDQGAKPVLEGLRLVPARFRVAAARGARTAKTGRPPAGTRIRFTLSQAAQVTFTVHRSRPGRRSGGACRAPKPGVRSRRCTRWVKAGAFIRNAEAGVNSLRWGGRIGKRALKAGRYRLTARARTGDGPRSQPRRKRFRIVRG